MFRPRNAFLLSFMATCAVVFASVVSVPVQAASSYFMVQGPLSAGGVYETYKFRVEYTGVLQISGFETGEQGSGYALIGAIFGNGSLPPSGSFTNSVGTAQFNGSFLDGFRMEGGSMVVAGFNYPVDPQWNYFVSGGSYVNTFPPVSAGDYDDDTWTWSYTGVTGRYLSDGSIDAWSFAAHVYSGFDDPDWGPIFFPPLPAGVAPTLGDFTGPLYAETKVSADGLPYSVYRITAVPEPGRVMLFLLSAGVVLVRRSRMTFL